MSDRRNGEAGVALRPRIGFLGVGWIGLQRLRAMLETGVVEVAGIADISAANSDAARGLARGAECVANLGELLEMDLDGVVIATPSALHAEQSIAALESGAAVFCQKPLGRTAEETRRVVEAARVADRLLGIDLSYRYTDGMVRIAELARSGELGRIFFVDLVFHNAYGPDKPWFYDPALSGGGCVIDLGVHLVDLALWALGFPDVADLSANLLSAGQPLAEVAGGVEDFAAATLTLADGAVARIACSWRLHAGRDAEISASFFGTEGGASLRNVSGSFHDFTAERFRGTSRETLASPPDAWGGRAAADWARRLAAGARFDAAAERFVDVARVLDRIYGR
ncbi:MAG: Gfo/Idh/MocA family oxidoreductase [Caulobacteraceae bacterium]